LKLFRGESNEVELELGGIHSDCRFRQMCEVNSAQIASHKFCWKLRHFFYKVALNP
jgi:hypothetical protein